jgi:hypothetical protein
VQLHTDEYLIGPSTQNLRTLESLDLKDFLFMQQISSREEKCLQSTNLDPVENEHLLFLINHNLITGAYPSKYKLSECHEFISND